MLTVVVIAAIAILVFFVFIKNTKKSRDTHSSEEAVKSTGIPDGLEPVYMDGIAPEKCGLPVMYTLHTCRHCVHLKDFLAGHGIDHHLVYVDDFADPARMEIMRVLRSYNPRGSFPTLVLPDGRSCVGFREGVVRDLLGIVD